MAIEVSNKTSIIELLKEDHDRFRSLFTQFERGDDRRKQEVAKDFMRRIVIHDQVEKKLLYPYATEVSPEAEKIVLRSKEAHHIVNFLLLELRAMPFGPRFSAKFQKVIDGVRAHMTEEENELFPLIEASDIDVEELGEKMIELKDRLEAGSMMSRAANGGMGAWVAAAALVGIGYYAYRSGKFDMSEVKEAVGVGGRSWRSRKH